MNLYVWHYLDQVSSRYHSGGGLMVFAATEERAREIANATPDVKVLPADEPANAVSEQRTIQVEVTNPCDRAVTFTVNGEQFLVGGGCSSSLNVPLFERAE